MTLFDSSEVTERIETKGQSDSLCSNAPTCRVGFGLSYDGSGFHGFAPQPTQRTVAGQFYEALSTLTGVEVSGVCAGRTDVGVHATAQVVHVDCDEAALRTRFSADLVVGTEISKLARALTSLLGPEIVVAKAIVVGEAFDARRLATARRYRYLVDANVNPSPLRRHVAWQLGEPLDLAVLRIATDPLLGEHDFAAFCRRPSDRPCASLVRRVSDAVWRVGQPGELVFEIEANAFCHQMVRSIVGSLVAVGSAKLRPSDIVSFLRQKDRSNMPALAPSHGLCLVEVCYPPPYGEWWSSA